MDLAINQIEIKNHTSLLPILDIDQDLKDSNRPNLYAVKGNYFKNKTYILESTAALDILLNPWIVGSKMASAARKSSLEFLQVAYQISPEFQNAKYNEVVEVIPLAGALYYNISRAFEEIFHETLLNCFIGARRIFNQQNNEWATILSYLNFEALPENAVILMGDTIATGGTIEKIIRATIENANNPRAIILYSIAGSLIGAHKISKLQQEYNIPIYVFMSNALFGIADNGTDMPWLHPATLLSETIRQKVLKMYGPRLGEDWCSVWDWGERAKDPVKHLQNLLKIIDGLLNGHNYDRGDSFKTKQILKKIEQNTKLTLNRFEQKLSFNNRS